MRSPRYSIAGLMALVAIVALDCSIIQAYRGHPPLEPNLADLLVFGALPMANLLSLGLVALLGGRPRRGPGRRTLARLEVFGGVALLVFLACAWLAAGPIHDGVGEFLRPLGMGSPLFLSAAALTLLLPQVGLALAGLRLARRATTRPQEGGPPPGVSDRHDRGPGRAPADTY
jgi:hypothetical protein